MFFLFFEQAFGFFFDRPFGFLAELCFQSTTALQKMQLHCALQRLFLHCGIDEPPSSAVSLLGAFPP